MGLLNSALQIGRSALLSYQSALQIVGNNISNAGSASYTRQTPGLTPINGPAIGEGMRPGAGVALTSLHRNLDEALENRIRMATGEAESDLASQRSMGLVETLFDPLTGLQVQQRLGDFFNSMDQVQNDPTDAAIRGLAIASASSLTDSLRQLRASLVELGDAFNSQIAGTVERANTLTEQVAELNTEIVMSESSGGPASALRDQRDALLRQLSELVGVTARELPTGAVNVYIANEVLVDGGTSRGLKVVSRLDGEFQRDSVAFADNNNQVVLRGGNIEGLIKARDEQAHRRIADIDRLAAAIVFEVNKVHADGQGLVGFTSITSNYAVDDPTAVLGSDAAGLAFAPTNGSFYISVTDDTTGVTSSFLVEVDLDGIGDDDTTLESLVADLNENVAGVTASITPDNRLSIVADSGGSITFGHDGQSQRPDTSHILAALGINTLFSGSSAADIAVDASVATQSSFFAASGVNITGDGTNAGRLASLGDASIEDLSGGSILDAYSAIVGEVAVASATARESVDASASILGSLQAQKENISGVSLDEEAIELLKFERAFQGAARFVSVVDRLTSEMIALVR